MTETEYEKMRQQALQRDVRKFCPGCDGGCSVCDPVPPYEALRYEAVNHPQHYRNHPSGVECVTISEHFPHCLASAIEYIWRAGLKPGADTDEDLRKAVWWLERHRELLKRSSGETKTLTIDAEPEPEPKAQRWGVFYRDPDDEPNAPERRSYRWPLSYASKQEAELAIEGSDKANFWKRVVREL